MTELLPWPVLATINLLRLLVVGTFLFVLLPWLLFAIQRGQSSDPLVSRALWMLFGITAAVHVLVPARLYEVMVMLVAVAAITWLIRRRAVTAGVLQRLNIGLAAWFFDLIDGKVIGLGRRSASPRAKQPAAVPWWRWAAWAVLAATVAVAAYRRMALAFVHAAPPFSDAPVHLVWAKHLQAGSLYHGEVYPRGLHVLITLLQKFTALNLVEVVVLTGPLLGFLLALSVVYYTYRVTGSAGAAAVAALLYGSLTWLLPISAGRQTGLNAHEYGLIFVLPAAWFTFAYLTHGRPADRAAAAAAAGLTMFTHPVPVLFVLLSMAATAAVAVLTAGRGVWRRLWSLVGWGAAAACIATAPLLAAVALGEPWHASSSTYLGRFLEVHVPSPPNLYLLTLFCAALLVVLGVVAARLHRWPPATDPWAPRAAAAAVAAVGIILFYLPYAGLKSKVLMERGTDLTGMALAVAAGLGWNMFESVLGRLRPLAITGLIALVAGTWLVAPPLPAQPSHYIFSHEQVLQYLRVDKRLVGGQWTLVMPNTGYALALRRGFHMDIDSFIAMTNRLPADPARWISRGEALGYGITEHYILMVEKTVVVVPGQEEEVGAPRLAAAARLQAWIDANRAALPLEQIFDGDEVTVWHLALPVEHEPYGVFRQR